MWWLWPGGVSYAKCAKSTPSLWGGLTIPRLFLAPTRWSHWCNGEKMSRHGHKLRIKGHRGLVVDEEVAWTCTKSCKRARKRSLCPLYLPQPSGCWNVGEHGTSKPERKTVHHPQQALWAFATTTIIHVVQATQRQTTGRICSCTEHGKSEANQMHNATQHSAQHSQCPCLNLLDPTLGGGFFHE